MDLQEGQGLFLGTEGTNEGHLTQDSFSFSLFPPVLRNHGAHFSRGYSRLQAARGAPPMSPRAQGSVPRVISAA